MLGNFKPRNLGISTPRLSPGDVDGFATTVFGDPLHLFLVKESQRLKQRYRVDFYPAFLEWEGMGSVVDWMGFFGATRDDPPQAKGIIALTVAEKESYV